MKIPKEEFIKFSKIPRYRRECNITEKIDGTNALIFITADLNIHAGSRNRWLTTDKDNYEFAEWVEKNKTQLIMELKPGFHRGEWCGKGIQRAYGLNKREFVLFNTSRYEGYNLELCKVVPIIVRDILDDYAISTALDELRLKGSLFAPGFMNPEGVVINTLAGRFKVTLENDELPKGRTER